MFVKEPFCKKCNMGSNPDMCSNCGNEDIKVCKIEVYRSSEYGAGFFGNKCRTTVVIKSIDGVPTNIRRTSEELMPGI